MPHPSLPFIFECILNENEMEEKQMSELSIMTRQVPGIAEFENFEEIKAYLAARLENYRNLTYSENSLKLAKISTKACLCHYIISIRHRHTCGNEGVASMCDIGERTSMHEGWSLLCSLYEIGL